MLQYILMYRKIILFLIFCLSLASFYKYEEKVEGNSAIIVYEVYQKNQNDFLVTISSNSSFIEVLTDKKKSAKYFKLDSENEKYTMNREQDFLEFSGIANEDNFNKSIKVGSNSSWYINYFFFSDFILSQEERLPYFFALPFNQSVMKMVAIKEQVEQLEYNNQLVDAVKVRFTLDDWRSFMWSSYGWFRVDDGVLLKAEEMRGPPGSPKIFTFLLEEG
jgi:hypothetical protein